MCKKKNFNRNQSEKNRVFFQNTVYFFLRKMDFFSILQRILMQNNFIFILHNIRESINRI